MKFTRRALLAGTPLLVTGCGASLAQFPFDVSYPHPPRLGLEVTFYGVGCFKLTFDDFAVLSDPFWSYLPFTQVAFGEVLPDPKQVDPYLDQLSEVKTVLIGHNHYDHNLDLPYVAPHLHPDAVVLGSDTMMHTFAPSNLPIPLVGLNASLATVDTVGEWWVHPSKRLRVLPILSGHPNNYLFIHLFQERLSTDRQSKPTKASHYQEGETLAFLVDHLDVAGNIACRVYIQTSSTGYPAGFFPAEILDEHPVDVALLAMDCANLKMKGHQTIIDFLCPSVVLFCHWEDFFRRKDQSPREIVKVNLPKAHRFFKQRSESVYLFPGFDSQFHL